MIGDSITLVEHATDWGVLPDAVSHALTVTRVNQDNFGTEYRASGALGRHVLRLRNQVEAASTTKVAMNRHLCDYSYTLDALDAQGRPVVFQTYVITRYPVGGTKDTVKAIHYAGRGALPTSYFAKVLNFES